jgi:hypothetical protein
LNSQGPGLLSNARCAVAVQVEPGASEPKGLATTTSSYVAALTAFDSQWSRADRAMIEVLPAVIPPGGVHAVLGRKAPPAAAVYLTNWRTQLPTLCDVTARVLLPRTFDADARDVCPLCAEMVRGSFTSPRR